MMVYFQVKVKPRVCVVLLPGAVKKEVYFMAIIDILTHYDAKKKAAHAAKTVKHGVSAKMHRNPSVCGKGQRINGMDPEIKLSLCAGNITWSNVGLISALMEPDSSTTVSFQRSHRRRPR